MKMFYLSENPTFWWSPATILCSFYLKKNGITNFWKIVCFLLRLQNKKMLNLISITEKGKSSLRWKSSTTWKQLINFLKKKDQEKQEEILSNNRSGIYKSLCLKINHRWICFRKQSASLNKRFVSGCFYEKKFALKELILSAILMKFIVLIIKCNFLKLSSNIQANKIKRLFQNLNSNKMRDKLETDKDWTKHSKFSFIYFLVIFYILSSKIGTVRKI